MYANNIDIVDHFTSTLLEHNFECIRITAPSGRLLTMPMIIIFAIVNVRSPFPPLLTWMINLQ